MARSILSTLALLVLSACDTPPGSDTGGLDAGRDAGGSDEVLVFRDEYGVPHIYAATNRGAAYALGYTDGEDLGVEALRLVYSGTGESTRRMGPSCTACPVADLFTGSYRLNEVVARDYDRLEPDTRAWIEAYAEGLSAYFDALPSPPPEYDPADPPDGHDVAASFLYGRAAHALSETNRGIAETGGSNQLVITGARTRGEATFALKDPHSPWQRAQRYAHVSIAGFELFGNFAFGGLACGANDSLAFGCTRAGPTPGIRIEAALRYVGEHPAEGACAAAPSYEHMDHAASGYTATDMHCVDVAGTGTWVYESRFGPGSEFGEDADLDGHPDTLTFLHLFAANDVASIDYRIHTTLARTTSEYVAAFSGPTPPEDAQYRAFADRTHHIGGILGATTPVLDPALMWSSRLSSGDARIDSWTTSRDWTDLTTVAWHNIDGVPPELPHVLDPMGDFFENCNGNPRFGTDPEGQIGTVPITLERATGPTERDSRMVALIRGRTDLDMDSLVDVVTDVRVPFAPELVDAARCGVVMLGVDPVTEWGDGGRMLETLFSWGDAGYLATPDAEGATLAALLEAAVPTLVYPARGTCLSRAQLDTLAGNVFRDALAPYMRMTYSGFADPLRVPWGHLNYVIVEGREVGLPGMVVGRLVTLLPTSFTPATGTGRADPTTTAGSALLQLTGYTESGWAVRILPPLGQISDVVHPSSSHLGQTIDAYVAREPREVWLRRSEIEAHLCPFEDEPGHEHRAVIGLLVP